MNIIHGVFGKKYSRAELDLYIATSEQNQAYSINNSLVRTRERENAELWPGEVALYEHANYKGRVWILHHDTPDFVKINGLNDQISSIRLGPDTAVTFFKTHPLSWHQRCVSSRHSQSGRYRCRKR